jgi:DNA ligase-1
MSTNYNNDNTSITTFSYSAKVCESISHTNSKNEKVRILADYLSLLDDESLIIACTFLSNRALHIDTGLELNVGYSLLWSVLESISKACKDELIDVYLKYGDIGIVAEHAVNKIAVRPLVRVELTLRYVYEQFINIAKKEGKDSLSKKKDILVGLFANSSPIEAKYLAKIIANELRIGVVEGLLEHAIASAFNKDYSAVEDAYLACNNLADVALQAKYNRLDTIIVRPSKPIAFMLADTLTSIDNLKEYPKPLIVEYKYDGVRAQVHKYNSNVKIFSRGLEDISKQFPEIVEGIKSIITNDAILDGEIVAFKDGKMLAFNILQRRLGRKDYYYHNEDDNDSNLKDIIEVKYIAFDILYYNGKILLKEPLIKRKELLFKAVNINGNSNKEVEVAWYTLAYDEQIIHNMLKESIDKGYEGLMIKDSLSYYRAGKRGKHWLKLKGRRDTVDAVIVAAEYGHGKRAGLLSDYTFAVKDSDSLKVIGKAYTGLSDEEIRDLTLRLKSLTIKDEGLRLIVKPSIVIEVEFDSVVKSSRYDSGYALRFPRIKAIRYDKGIEDIDTLDKVKAMASR